MVKVIPRSGRIAAVLLGGLLAAVGTLAGGVEATASTGHDLPAGVPAVPSPGTSSQLNGIFCPSATNCWAVGTYFNGTAGLDEALHWNGSKWAQVAAPSPGGTGDGDFSVLLGGRCTAPADCWAVGYYSQAGGAQIDLMLHWNGAKWSKVTVPSPGGTGAGSVNALSDIACRSSSSCWAAGEYGLESSSIVAIRNNVLHWNGTKWSQVTVPNPVGTANLDINSLASIRCPTNNDCWAVGETDIEPASAELNEALHWDGSSWTVATVPDPGGTAQYDFSNLVNLACTSSANCWAGGYYGNVLGENLNLNQLLHWDGTAWTQANPPQPGGTSGNASNEIYGVDCASASDCWAVGLYGGAGASLNQALHWDGTAWTQAVTPNPGGTAPGDVSELFGVHCAGATLCWAVGDTSAGPSEALRWNGTTWSTG